MRMNTHSRIVCAMSQLFFIALNYLHDYYSMGGGECGGVASRELATDLQLKMHLIHQNGIRVVTRHKPAGKTKLSPPPLSLSALPPLGYLSVLIGIANKIIKLH